MSDPNTAERPLDFAADLSLLQSALRRAVEIGLSDDQLNRLRDAYAEGKRGLNKANAELVSAELDLELAQSLPGDLSAAGAVAEVETIKRRMTDIRIRTMAVALAVLTEEQRHVLTMQGSQDEKVRSIVAGTGSTGKDSKVVEIEIAMAVLDRMIGWAKIFAWCVAIPGAILVAIFAVAGIGKFADFISRVNESEKRVGEYVAKSEKQVSDLLSRATDTVSKYQAQLNAIEQRQSALQETVDELEQLVGAPGSKIPSAVLSKLQQAFRPFQSYLIKLGYQPERPQIRFAYADPKMGSVAYYNDGTVYVKEEYASAADLAFREYLHHVLWDGGGRPINKAPIAEAASAVESGLADYFVASYSKNPRPYPPEFKVNLEQQPVFSIGQRIQRFETGRILASAFWAMRAALEPDLADRIVFESWRSPSVSNTSAAISEMVQSILKTTTRLAPERLPEVTKILRERGLTV